MRSVRELVRPNILSLSPYKSAREEFAMSPNMVYLDANESPIDNGFNRYPDALQTNLRQEMADLKGLSADQICFGNGSDELIDLLIRIFCEPGKDSILTLNPTYGMYKVTADVNNISTNAVFLNEEFSLSEESFDEIENSSAKLFFLCNPNNPTGSIISQEEIVRISACFKGVLVVDEAYIDFSDEKSSIDSLDKGIQIAVLQTFSKSMGAANLRLGTLFSSPEIIELVMRIKPPYNISQYSLEKGKEILQNRTQLKQNIGVILEEKQRIFNCLKELAIVQETYPSGTNFLLVRVTNAKKLYKDLLAYDLVLRDRSNEYNCENCLRISVGTEEQNNKLINALKTLSNEESLVY